MDFKWQHPEYLWLGPALFLLVIVASFAFQRWRKNVWVALGLDPDHTKLVRSSFGKARYFTRQTLLALALLCFGFALANLQMGGKKQKVNRKGADIVFALDVSRSMLAEDIAPSRLEKAKLLISKSLDQLGGDRVGIIAYAGSAYPALPITTDYAAAKMALQAATPDAAPSQGTNLSAALEYALGYFNTASPAGRFIVVLTDGEDHESIDSDLLPDFPVNIMVVGLGTQGGGPIPMSKTRVGTTYKKDKNGEVVITRRDEGKLSTISDRLGANYVDGNRTEKSLSQIQSFVEGGEKADISEEIAIDYDAQFSWFLLPGVLLLLLYLMLPSRVGNPLDKKATPLALALLFSLSGFSQNIDTTAQVFEPIEGSKYEYAETMKRGVKAAEEGNHDAAARDFIEAARREPGAFEPYYNLGQSLHNIGAKDEARGALQKALEHAETDVQRSNALHNLGNQFLESEEYEPAIRSYSESLRLQPDQPDAIYNLNKAVSLLKQQQNQEDQQDSEDKQDQEDKEQPENQKDDPQEQDPEQENSKEQQDQQDQSGENGDEKNQDKNENENGSPEEQDGNSEQNKPQEGGEAKAKMTPEEIKGLLEAIQRAEEKTAEKVTAQKAKGKKKSGEKDW
jgi:Ca-activated chloride channel homolog